MSTVELGDALVLRTVEEFKQKVTDGDGNEQLVSRTRVARRQSVIVTDVADDGTVAVAILRPDYEGIVVQGADDEPLGGLSAVPAKATPAPAPPAPAPVVEPPAPAPVG